MAYPTLDSYKVLSTLGTGGFSKVKLVEDPHGRRYAAKIIKDLGSQMTERVSESLHSEIESLKKLRHPNILNLLSYSEHGVYLKKGHQKIVTYLIIELCEKGTLFDYIFKNGCMEETTARHYFIQMLSALEYCHSEGICHRDLKPENILFDSEYNLKVSDFGFSVTIRGRSNTGFLGSEVGTQGYMPPEMYLHQPYRGEAADIFSLGVILFIMRSYNPPFIKASLTDPYYSLFTNREAKFWEFCVKNKKQDHFSPEFKALIKGMMAYNPNERFSMRDIKSSAWMQGAAIGPVINNGNEVVIDESVKNRATNDKNIGIDRVKFSGRMYRSFNNMRTSSIMNEDYYFKTITLEQLNLLKYSKIITKLEPNSIIQALSAVFEETQANYSPVTSDILLKVTVNELDFKIFFYKYEESIVIYLRKIRGNEYDLNEFYLKLCDSIQDTEEFVNSTENDE